MAVVPSVSPFARFVVAGWLRWSLVALGVMALLALALARLTDQEGFAVAPWLPLGAAFTMGALAFAFRCEQTGEIVAWQTAAPRSGGVLLPVVTLAVLAQVPCAFLDGSVGSARALDGQVVASVEGDLLWQFERGGAAGGVLLSADGTVSVEDPGDVDFAPAPADPRRYRRVSLLARAALSSARDALDPGWLRWALLAWCAVAPALVLAAVGRAPAQPLLLALIPFAAVALA